MQYFFDILSNFYNKYDNNNNFIQPFNIPLLENGIKSLFDSVDSYIFGNQYKLTKLNVIFYFECLINKI